MLHALDSLALTAASKLLWVNSLSEVSSQTVNVASSHRWRSSIHYLWSPTSLHISIDNVSTAYGWEFFGGQPNCYAVTPATDRFVLQAVSAIASSQSIYLPGTGSVGASTMIHGASVLCGRLHIDLQPSLALDLCSLGHLLSGAVSSGAWLSVSLTDAFSPVLAFIGEFAFAVSSALASKCDRYRTLGQECDLPIAPGHALILNMRLFDSSTPRTELPHCIRHSMRSVSLLPADPTVVLEIFLTSMSLPSELGAKLSLLIQQGALVMSSYSRHLFCLKRMMQLTQAAARAASHAGPLSADAFVVSLHQHLASAITSRDSDVCHLYFTFLLVILSGFE